MLPILVVVILAAIGLVIGAVAAGTLGGVFGIGVGMLLALGLNAVRRSTRQVPQDAEREQVEVLCIPNGTRAKCEVARDKDTGRWLDVVNKQRGTGLAACCRVIIDFSLVVVFEFLHYFSEPLIVADVVKVRITFELSNITKAKFDGLFQRGKRVIGLIHQ